MKKELKKTKKETIAEVRKQDLYNLIMIHLDTLEIELKIDHIDNNTNKPVYNLYTKYGQQLVLTDQFDGSIKNLFHFAVEDYLNNLLNFAEKESKDVDVEVYPSHSDLTNEFELCPRCGKVYKKDDSVRHLEHGCIL